MIFANSIHNSQLKIPRFASSKLKFQIANDVVSTYLRLLSRSSRGLGVGSGPWRCGLDEVGQSIPETHNRKSARGAQEKCQLRLERPGGFAWTELADLSSLVGDAVAVCDVGELRKKRKLAGSPIPRNWALLIGPELPRHPTPGSFRKSRALCGLFLSP
jgi:hypothetical protein